MFDLANFRNKEGSLFTRQFTCFHCRAIDAKSYFLFRDEIVGMTIVGLIPNCHLGKLALPNWSARDHFGSLAHHFGRRHLSEMMDFD